MCENKMLLMEIGAEGGSLMLYCDQNSASPKYWVVTDESYELDEEDGGAWSTHREEDARDTWRDALNSSCAGEYWFKLYPLFVDAAIQANVLTAVIEAAGSPSLDRWVTVCLEQAKVDAPDEIALARRVLLMVGELHRLGYQLLRIAPGMASSGPSWRCLIVPNVYTSAHHGAMLHDAEDSLLSWGDAARYSTADEGRYFGWPDAADLTPQELAHRFLGEFPTLAKLGEGSDWAYAGWYQEMVRLTAPANIPIAYSLVEEESEGPAILLDLDKDGFMPTKGERSDIWIPIPPLSDGFV